MKPDSNSDSPIVVREFCVAEECPAIPQLLPSEVHTWLCGLNRDAEQIAALQSPLSPDESHGAQRYRFDADRNEFIITRGTLRKLLAMYLSARPAELRFAYSSNGRPAVAGPAFGNPVDFNISHSGGMALLAFSRGCRIGTDIERVRRDFHTGEIAGRFFSAAERAALRELPVEQRYEAFFRCWTRKEAFIKALGEGLSRPLDEFDVSLAPGAPAALLATRPNAGEATRWSLWNIAVPCEYAAALAVELPREIQAAAV